MHSRILAVTLLLGSASFAFADADGPQEIDGPRDHPSFRSRAGGGASFGTATSNCGGTYLGVGVGGTWDWDTGVAGTDSTQGWRMRVNPVRFGATRPPVDRLEWARDYGNQINQGDQKLWDARVQAGRAFVRAGVAGAWHADGMGGVKRNLADGGEPSATPIAGARSAWCGLRESGNTHPDGIDALSGNYLNGDLAYDIGSLGSLPEFPGYCNLWDQMLYKDFPASTGAGTVAFRVRTDMSNFVDTTPGGTGWMNPFADPEIFANYVANPADSFMVYVGTPNDLAYDVNRRFFSEVLDLSKPHAEIFAVGGVYPHVAADTAITRAYAGLEAGTIRVVFRVKTNRVRADQSTGNNTGYNSKQGAALVDQVSVDGGPAEGFETTAQVAARSLIPNLSAPGGPWATTGRPPHQYLHIENVLASGLAYEDLCGAIGAPTRMCNLVGNVLVAGDHDHPDHILHCGPSPKTENYLMAESPTIDLAVRTAAPGTKNAQGIDQETASRTAAVVQFDFYSGHMDLDESVFYYFGARAHAPQYVSPGSGQRVWTGAVNIGGLFFNPDPTCYTSLGSLWSVYPAGQVDSLRVGLVALTQGYRFAGTNLGNTRGFYFDNVRVGFVRTAYDPPPAYVGEYRLADQFPWNEAVAPGDHAGFDTTAALMRTSDGTSDGFPARIVAGDSIVVQANYLGDGIAYGTRLDLVFRIDPGPGNHVVPGDRSSALVDRDPAHPFFARYLAANGPFGTPGGHGGTWNPHVWNSARMDSAELNLHPLVSRNIGGPVSGRWMGTLHEQDPHFAALGILRPVCFLTNPAGPDWDPANIECDGGPPAVYGAIPGTTREGTKILPDGWFTPGTHIEYFLRRSTIEEPGTFVLLPDTNRVVHQESESYGLYYADQDADRWHSVDVLPDLWKSERFDGLGTACVLLVDAGDRRGTEPVVVGALDSLGYGKNNGAKKGWKGLGPGSDPDDPAGFVPANLGQAGLNFDLFEYRSGHAFAGSVGSRLDGTTPAAGPRGATSGPSPAMLAAFYRTVAHLGGDAQAPLQDGTYDRGDDVRLYDDWLTGATADNLRNLWISGNNVAEWAILDSEPGGDLQAFLQNRLGAGLASPNFKVRSQSQRQTVGLIAVADWAQPRIYGLNHGCAEGADVLTVNAGAAGALIAANYEPVGPGSGFIASIHRPSAVGRPYRTLLDGFDVASLRGHYTNLGDIAVIPETGVGRIAWIDEVLSGYFQICARRGAFVGIGDLPGLGSARFANLNRGAAPNPAPRGGPILLRFTLAKPGAIRVRLFSATGREVASIAHAGLAGPNALAWDGRLSGGGHAPAGVYFYRIDGIPFERGSSPAKLVLVGPGR
jgi:hypothetical protein